MTDLNMTLSSLSMDLYRVAQAAHRGSHATCQRFLDEAFLRIGELNTAVLTPSIQQTLVRVKQLPTLTDDQRVAEYALVYSIVIKNHVVHNP